MRRADRSKLEGIGFTWLELSFDQPEPKKRTATLGQVELVPPLGHNLLSATSAIKASDNLVIVTKNEGRVDSGEGAYRSVLKNGMYVADRISARHRVLWLPRLLRLGRSRNIIASWGTPTTNRHARRRRP